MDKKKVFVGYDLDLNRCLLYKKNDNTYIDLEYATKYSKDDIYEQSLISYEDIVKYSIANTKKEIKKEFLKTESEIIPLDDIFIGDVIRIDTIEDLVESDEKVDISPALNAMLYNSCINYELKKILVPASISFNANHTIFYQDRLFRRHEDYLGYKYEDMLSGQIYTSNSLTPHVGDITVRQEPICIKDAFDDLISEDKLSKKDIIRLYLVGQSAKNSAKINKKEV